MTRSSVTIASNMLARIRGTRYGKTLDYDSGALTNSDVAILRFLSALELIESDVWQQYDELGGVKQDPQDPYRLALQSLQSNLSHFITSCALDEISHTTYLNLYLESEGVDPVDLDRYRTLRGSRAAGALNVGQLTNLQHLNLELGWTVSHSEEGWAKDSCWSSETACIIDLQSIPSTDMDFEEPSEIRMIAKTALLHFGYLENLMWELYAGLSQRIRRAKILAVTLGIGCSEIAHYHASLDLTRRFVLGARFSIDDSVESTNNLGRLNPGLPVREKRLRSIRFPFSIERVSPNEPVARSSGSDCSMAARAIDRLAKSGLFIGHSPEFTRVLFQMAYEADKASIETPRWPIPSAIPPSN
ncbi:MAG: hypothetical protein WBQ94_28740 [Terracidiphilus sp.]